MSLKQITWESHGILHGFSDNMSITISGTRGKRGAKFRLLRNSDYEDNDAADDDDEDNDDDK